MANTIKLYSVPFGKEKDFDVVLDGNGDFVATDPDDGQFVKFPGSGDLAALALAYNRANGDQVPVDPSGNPILSADQQASLDAASVATGATQAPASPVDPAQIPAQ